MSHPPRHRPKPRWLVWAEFLPVALLVPFLLFLPHRLALFLGRVLGLGAYYLLRTYRAVAHTNLALAFGDRLSAEERRGYARGAFVNALQTFLEFGLTYRMSRRAIARLTPGAAGYEAFKAAFAEGRGVLAVSAHFGNWYWPALCAALEGYPVNLVVRPLDNPLLDGLMNRVFQHWGVRVIPRRQAMAAARAALRRGEVVALMVDQNAAIGGRFVPFFGVPAATMRGLPVLRGATGAEVVGISCAREGVAHRVALDWLRGLPADEPGCLLAVHRYLEGVIEAHPDQYFWLHPRWKKRPPGEPSLYPGLRI